MPVALILARIIHIVCGVYWVGAVLFINFYLGPALNAAGPSGPGVMRALMQRNFFAMTLWMATLTILAGLYLVWHDSAGFDPAWFRMGMGMAISIGMLCALIAYLAAVFMVRPLLHRMADIGAQLANGPNAALMDEMNATRMRLMRVSIPAAMLLVAAVVTMAVARYV